MKKSVGVRHRQPVDPQGNVHIREVYRCVFYLLPLNFFTLASTSVICVCDTGVNSQAFNKFISETFRVEVQIWMASQSRLVRKSELFYHFI